jgi:hypothetical protein
VATFPFAGLVARAIGQRFQVDGSADAREIRAEVRRTVGDRSAVEVAARKAYTTFEHLGLIDKQGQLLVPAAAGSATPEALGPWLIHALLLTRQADSLPISSIANAPEWMESSAPSPVLGDYRFLEAHAQLSSALIARV